MSNPIELVNVRSVTTGEGTRVRCDIDFSVQPGSLVSAEGVEFEVTYINYYVTNGGTTAYMDVGTGDG